jgi:hypothetical protein
MATRGPFRFKHYWHNCLTGLISLCGDAGSFLAGGETSSNICPGGDSGSPVSACSPVLSAQNRRNVSPGPPRSPSVLTRHSGRITGRLRSSCRHSQFGRTGHNHAAAPYTSPVDASGAANTVSQALGASARCSQSHMRCPVQTGRRKLQELPSCQFRGHLSRRHARKVPLGRWIG